MIEIDEEMEEWGTETAEGPKIWGATVIYSIFLLLFYFLFRQNLGVMAPLAPGLRRPCKWLPAMRLLCLVSDDDQVQVTQHPTIIKICEARKKCQ